MAAPPSIAYELGRHGWSSFKLTIGDTSVDVGPFGYCTDALGDLIRAALMVATSGDRAEVSFDGEPRECRLIGDWHRGAGMHQPQFRLRVLIFADICARSPEAAGETIFEAYSSVGEFARAVEVAAQTIWNEYGADGYYKAWGGAKAFPLRALQALKIALSTEEPIPLPPDPESAITIFSFSGNVEKS